MSALSIQVPFPVFQDQDGQPLENGYIWIGTANLDPQGNPINVYWDKALTQLAAQPLRTINGYISNSGTPAQVYVDAVNFSIRVQNSKGTTVYSFPEGTGISPNACGVDYDPPFAGAVSTNVEAKLAQTVSVKDFGAVGDGVTDDTAAFGAAATYAATVNRPILLTGETYIVTTLTLNVDAHFVGTGTIRKKPGTTGYLIASFASLKIGGDITLDQNAANCPNPSATALSDCAVFQSGPSLELIGVTIPAAVSANIHAIPTQSLRLVDCTVDGGWLNVLASCGNTAKVEVIRGVYSNATKDDNIQINSSPDFLIDGVESFGSFRSGIVVAGGSKNGRIVNCYSHDNLIDTVANQGGWGIVCSTSVNHVTIANNVCRNNERGPCTLDVYDPGVKDAYLVVTGNDFDGEYNGGYGTTGVCVNGARFVSITGNRIRKCFQHVLGTFNDMTLIEGNSMEDCGAGYFVQFCDADWVKIAANQMKTTANNTSAGAISSFRCDYFEVSGNQILDVNGSGRHAFRLTDTNDFRIVDNTVQKTDSGSGYVFFFTGTLSRGRISGNRFYSGTTAWQYYIVATGTTLADIVTERNEITVPAIQTNPNRYILNGAAIVGDGDTINNVRDRFSAAPTAWTFRDGYIAINNNIAQFWNGAAWVNI